MAEKGHEASVDVRRIQPATARESSAHTFFVSMRRPSIIGFPPYFIIYASSVATKHGHYSIPSLHIFTHRTSTHHLKYAAYPHGEGAARCRFFWSSFGPSYRAERLCRISDLIRLFCSVSSKSKVPITVFEDVCEVRRTMRKTCRLSKLVALQAWKRDVERMRPGERFYELAFFIECRKGTLVELLREAVKYVSVQ